MIEFTVVKHEFYPTSAPDSQYGAVLKSQRGNYLFMDAGQSILAEFPVGAKFVLLPADLAVAPLFEQKIDDLVDSSMKIADEARNRDA